MKKKIAIIAIAVVAVAAVVAPTLAGWDMDGRHDPSEGNFVCYLCKGSGRNYGPQGPGTGPLKCNVCKGTGFNGGY